MTRYTKLSRREVPASTTSPGPDDVDVDERTSSPHAPAPAAAVQEAAAVDEDGPSSSTASPPTEVVAEESVSAPKTTTTTTTTTTATATTAADDPPKPKTKEQLLKRAKLLKLKAKKAKTPESSKKFLKQAWDLEKESDALSYSGPKRGRPDEGRGGEGGGGGGFPSSNKRARHDAVPAEPEPTNPWKRMFAQQQAGEMDKSEARRLKRIEERAAKTKCFACRGLGHEARDCPQALDAESNRIADGGSAAETTKSANGHANAIVGKETVGICFRCGSTQHTLNKCRKPAPKVGDELPFATCFVCGNKGHLSSKCPSNKGRGVYPDGGCCKLCQSVDHLARDCPLSLRRDPNSSTTAATAALVDSSTGVGAGADEDHFHSLARRKVEVESERQDASKVLVEKVGGGGKRKVVSF